MSINIGVIGTGRIGTDHIRRLTDRITAASVIAVSDIDAQRASDVARSVPQASPYRDAHDLIASDAVNAVVVTSSAPTHESYVLAAIEAGKPVFCEKPLADTADGCLRIVEAEAARGQRLVQVGFMRRYDPQHRALKAALDEGTIGTPLLAHCAHRNPRVPAERYTSDMSITGAAIHEIDSTRWLFDEEVATVQVLKPRRSPRAAEHLQDPQVVLLETHSGIHVDVEVFVNCGYGYDIRCEVVGEDGTVSLADHPNVVLVHDHARQTTVTPDWATRFGTAYDIELHSWVESVASAVASGPSAWDGYAAATIAEACITSLQTGQRTPVLTKDMPELYR